MRPARQPQSASGAADFVPGERLLRPASSYSGASSLPPQPYHQLRGAVSAPGRSAGAASSSSSQASHDHRHPHLEAIRRVNPIGHNGVITRAAEFVPGLNRGIQAAHKTLGHEKALDRARRCDPIGADGFLTRLGERIPVVNDGIMALHRRAGKYDQADRVRARTAQALLSTNGAVTRVAEMVPGLNLMAAAIHQGSGDHEAARRAVMLMETWHEVGNKDGALTKLAELIPGTDIVAFTAHLHQRNYANAIFCIVKMPWLEVRIRVVVVELKLSSVQEAAVEVLDLEGVELNPKTATTLGALVDISLHILGVKRTKDGLRDNVEEAVVSAINGAIRQGVALGLDELDVAVLNGIRSADAWLLSLHWQFHDVAWWHLKRRFLRWLLGIFPESIPPPRKMFFQSMRETVLAVELRHEELPLPKPVRQRDQARGVPETAGAVSCLSGLGSCIGFHAGCLGPVCCLAGVAAAAAQAWRMAGRRALGWLRDNNQEARRPFVGAGPPLLETFESCPAVVVELEKETAAALSVAAQQYLFDDLLGDCPCWRRVIRRVLRCLRGLASGPDAPGLPPSLPVEVHITVPAVAACSRKSGGPLDLNLPEMHLLLLLDIGFSKEGPEVLRAQVAMKEQMLHEVMGSMCQQLVQQDLRTLDPGLSGFSEPFGLHFDMHLQWPQPSHPRLEVTNFYVKMFLQE